MRARTHACSLLKEGVGWHLLLLLHLLSVANVVCGLVYLNCLFNASISCNNNNDNSFHSFHFRSLRLRRRDICIIPNFVIRLCLFRLFKFSLNCLLNFQSLKFSIVIQRFRFILFSFSHINFFPFVSLLAHPQNFSFFHSVSVSFFFFFFFSFLFRCPKKMVHITNYTHPFTDR